MGMLGIMRAFSRVKNEIRCDLTKNYFLRETRGMKLEM